MSLLNAPASARRLASVGGLGLLALGTSALAAPRQTGDAPAPSTGPIRDALQSVSEDVQIYNDHLTILASPWMEGRLPGTRGMELAKEYMEFQFRASGLVPAVKLDPSMGAGGESASFRQPFNLGSTNEVTAASLTLGTSSFEHGKGKDFTVTGLGVGGELDAPLVFVGYGIEDGRDRFTSFEEGTDLTGKVAVLLRFEPMDGEGNSLWTDRKLPTPTSNDIFRGDGRPRVAVPRCETAAPTSTAAGPSTRGPAAERDRHQVLRIFAASYESHSHAPAGGAVKLISLM